jgi:hypothetical protein
VARLRHATKLWTPARLDPSVLLGWWDASRLASLYADGASVDTWPDLSGRGRDLTQSTAAQKPTFRPYGFVGLPSVRGDGNDLLVNATEAPFNGLSKAYIGVVVSTTTGGQSDRYIVSCPNTSGGNGLDMRFASASSVLSMFLKSDTNNSDLNGTVTGGYNDGVPHVLEAVVDLTLAANDQEFVTGPNGRAAGSVGGSTIAAAYGKFFLFGFSDAFVNIGATVDIHEAVIANTPLYGRDRPKLREYFLRKWGARLTEASMGL